MCCLFLGQLRSNLDQKRFRLQTSEGSRLKGFHSGFRKVWLWIDLGIFLPSKQASCIRLVWQILAASLIPFFHITSPFKDGFSIDFIIFYPSKPICSYISQHFSISKQIFSYDSEYVPWIFWYFPSFLCPGLSPVLGPRWAKPREEGRTVTAAPWTWPKKWMVGKSCRKPTGFTYRFFHGLPHGTYFLFSGFHFLTPVNDVNGSKWQQFFFVMALPCATVGHSHECWWWFRLSWVTNGRKLTEPTKPMVAMWNEVI